MGKFAAENSVKETLEKFKDLNISASAVWKMKANYIKELKKKHGTTYDPKLHKTPSKV